MNTIKKVITLTEGDKIISSLISKARKPKGLAKWKKLSLVSEKLQGKQQAHIEFTSFNPKTVGVKRTLASKEGALDFLLGYVSPSFHFAPWHLQIINPELTEQKASEWFAIMKHPSKVPPSQAVQVGPEGDLESGFVHPSVAAEYPNKSIELFNAPAPVVETKAEVAPALVQPDPSVAPPEVEGGSPQDMMLACPFGGGLRCQSMGGSGAPWHHFHSESMAAHVKALGEENVEIPKMGTFKGQPALFFTHNEEPYVAIPTTQEVYTKTGSVYKWSFLAEGPLALKHPFVAKVMNHLATKRPLIIPDFGIPEPVVTIAHDSVPSEDPRYAEFAPDVFPLVQQLLPKPGSVIPLGVTKGERLFAVMTEHSIDFYDDLGNDAYYPAADGLYYAFFDLRGNQTPAFVLLSFINLFFPHIDTAPLEETLGEKEETEGAGAAIEPVGSTPLVETYTAEPEEPVESLTGPDPVSLSKALPPALPIGFQITLSQYAPAHETVVTILSRLMPGTALRLAGAPVSVSLSPQGGWRVWSPVKGAYLPASTLAIAADWLHSRLADSFYKYSKTSVMLEVVP